MVNQEGALREGTSTITPPHHHHHHHHLTHPLPKTFSKEPKTYVTMQYSYYFDSFRIMAVKSTISFDSYRLLNIVFETIDALWVSHTWIQLVRFFHSRRKERVFEKLVFYPQLRDSFLSFVSHSLDNMVRELC